MKSGDRVGRYAVLGKLAKGGMAEVWLARQSGPAGFHKLLVLKTIASPMNEDPQFVQMFLEEARLAALLNHPNVVQIFDLDSVGDEHFIAMEYLDGRNLGLVLKSMREARKPVPVALGARIAADACAGLDYAHSLRDPGGRPLNIIHRDVTAENMIVTYQGQVKLLDFGIAKAAESTRNTQPGTVRGKLAYLAPEQVLGRPLDRRVDIWALGVNLYSMVAGVPPFQADNELDFMRAIVDEAARAPSAHNPAVPPALDAIVLRALDKDPTRRFDTAGQFRTLLEEFLRDQPPAGPFQLAELMETLYPAAVDVARQKIRALVEADAAASADAGGGVLSPVPTTRPGTPPSARSLRSPTPTPHPLPGAPVPAPQPQGPPPVLDPGGLDTGQFAAMLEGALPAASHALPSAGPAPLASVSAPSGDSGAATPRPLTRAERGSTPAAAAAPVPASIADPALASAPVPAPSNAPAAVNRDDTTDEAPLRKNARKGAAGWVWAAGAAVLLLGVGALWPRGTPDAALTAATVRSTTAPSVPTPDVPDAAADIPAASPTALPEAAPSDPPRPLEPAPPAPPAPARTPEPGSAEALSAELLLEDDPPAPGGQRSARHRPSRTTGRMGQLSITSNVAAEVLVDGRRAGRTPLSRKVPAGAHQLTVTSVEGGAVRKLGVAVPENGRTEKSVAFGMGKLTVKAAPWAQVTVNGRTLGLTPLPPVALPEGTHQVVLENKELGRKKTLKVTIRANVTEELKVRMAE
jgi:serine/threonine protein kinase